MSRLRNQPLKLVVQAAALSAWEQRSTGLYIAAHRQASLSKSSCYCNYYQASSSQTRSFSSPDAEHDTSSLRDATWSASPQPARQPFRKEYNGLSWNDEYSWMDPSPPWSSGTRTTTASTSTASAIPNADRRAELLRRHLEQENKHTQRALAVAGVEMVKQRLLEELHDKYLGKSKDTPPERLGPYYYSLVSGPDGGLQAYLRTSTSDSTPAVAETAATTATAGEPGSITTTTIASRSRQQQQQRQRWPSEVLLSREIVAREGRLAEQMTGLRLGNSVGGLKLCPRHRLLAYSLPVLDRHDVFCVLVRDTASGQLVLPGGVVGGVAGPTGMELAADCSSLLVLQGDEGRPSKAVLYDLYCAAPPRVLFTETDPRFFLALGRTKDWALLLISSNSKTCSEVHVLDAAQPGSAPPQLVQPRTPGLEYFVEHYKSTPPTATIKCPEHRQLPPTPTPKSAPQKTAAPLRAAPVATAAAATTTTTALMQCEGHLIILTNADMKAMRGAGGGGDSGAVDSADGEGSSSSSSSSSGPRELTVVTAPLTQPGLQHWRPLLPERPGVLVTDMDLFGDRVVLYERRQGLPAVSVLPLSVTTVRTGSTARHGDGTGPLAENADHRDELPLPTQVPLPPWALHVNPGVNADPLSATLRLNVSSPLHPPTTLEYDMRTGRTEILAQETPPPAAGELLRRCSLLQLQVESAAVAVVDGGGGDGGDGAVGVVHVPVTLVLPPGVAFPLDAAEKESGSGGGSGGGGRLPGFTWRWISGPGRNEGSEGGGCCEDAVPDAGVVVGGSHSNAPLTTAYAPADELPKSAPYDEPVNDNGGGGGVSEADTPGLPRPLLLSVYGAYGLPLELQYDPTLLCLLARGWSMAKVHVRGGGELGRGWHAAGCRHLKRAAVEDCLAALRILSTVPNTASIVPSICRSTSPASPLTSAGLVAGHAISAGGVVLGAVLNAAPDIFGAAVLRCAFLELLGSCSDTDQPLTAHEWDEWGYPADPRDWLAAGELCPYRNLDQAVGRWRAAVLASCAEEDPRVHPSIPAKWVARLRDGLHRTHQTARAYDKEDSGDAIAVNDGRGGGGWWRRLLNGLLRGKTGSNDWVRQVPGDGGASDRPVLGTKGMDGRDGSNGGAGGNDMRGVCGPLLRVYFDGSGHVRADPGAQAEEVAEEMAFMLVALSSGDWKCGGDPAYDATRHVQRKAVSPLRCPHEDAR